MLQNRVWLDKLEIDAKAGEVIPLLEFWMFGN
jgi:hypothetical protein